MTGWKADKRWSDRFLPEIKQILGLYLIAEPPIEEDQERNTDLMVLKMDTIRVGCRVRKHEYFQKYPHDFTIRAGRPSGVKTELAKILEGWGQYLFYGFCDPDENRLQAWRLIDLNVFRLWFNRETGKLDRHAWPGTGRDNHDGSSVFRAFNIKSMPTEMVKAQSGNEGDESEVSRVFGQPQFVE